MKFCPECGSQLPLGPAKFCPNCGKNLGDAIDSSDTSEEQKESPIWTNRDLFFRSKTGTNG